MRKSASKSGRSFVGLGVPFGISFARPALAASFGISPDWPNYLLIASIAGLALSLTVKALEGRDRSRRTTPSVPPADSIDIYRNRLLKP